MWVLLLPFILYGFGAFLNVLVVSANHGMMPVVVPSSFAALNAPGMIMDDVHIVYDPANARLTPLIDWIEVPHFGSYSPGDMFIYLGDWMTVPFIGGWFGLMVLGKID